MPAWNDLTACMTWSDVNCSGGALGSSEQGMVLSHWGVELPQCCHRGGAVLPQACRGEGLRCFTILNLLDKLSAPLGIEVLLRQLLLLGLSLLGPALAWVL